MTSLLEIAVSFIAPHHCIPCSNESNTLCDACFFDVFDDPHDACFACNNPTKDSAVCPACRRQTPLSYVWMAGTDDGLRRKLIRAYKFERLRAANQPLAQAMLGTLPYLTDVTVVHIPTAPARIRWRGYDQSWLLARSIARQQGWRHLNALRRRHNLRQVGASKTRRARQAEMAYEVAAGLDLHGQHVLLVDDVTTSGATLTAAAKLMVKAGASRVDAVVAVKHTLK